MNDETHTPHPHHSLVDWEFAPDHIHSISGEQSFEGSKSLKSEGAPGGGPQLAVYPMDPLTFNMSFGRMSTAFLWHTYFGLFGLIMRSQSPVGTANLDNCYLIFIDHNRIRFGTMRDGTWYPYAQLSYSIEPNIWHQFEVYWQTQLQPDGTSPFQVTLYDVPHTGPKHHVATFHHPLDEWACSQLNRPGLMFGRHALPITYCDWTWIWHKRHRPEHYTGRWIKTLHPTITYY